MHSSSTRTREGGRTPSFASTGIGRGASPVVNVSASPSLSVPWHLRRTAKSDASESCWCLGSRYLLSRVEFAFRVAIIAALPVAILLTTESTTTTFVSKSFATVLAVAVSSPAIGEGIRTTAELLRSFCVWLPLATIMSAVDVASSEAWWWVAYCGISFLIGLLCEGFCRKVALLFFNLCMLAQRSGVGVDYPSRLAADALIGTAFGLLATMAPPFRTSSKKASKSLEQLFDNMSICFSGLTEAFWMTTNLTRSVDLKKIKFIAGQIDELADNVSTYLAEAEYEQLGASLSLIDMRMRLKLCKELQYALHALQRAVEIVEGTPDVIEADNARQFRDFMNEPLNSVAIAADNLLQTLSRPDCQCTQHHFDELNTSLNHFNQTFASASEASTVSARCGEEQRVLLQLLERQKEVEDIFRHSRAEVLYRNQKLSKVEEFHMPMGFFMFHHRLFVTTLAKFVEHRREWEAKAKEDCCGGICGRLFTYLACSPIYTLKKLKNIVTNPAGEVELRIIKEAFKTALALTLGTLFFLEYEPDNTAISGPAIIALVSGANTGEAMFASLMRLIGTIFGAVFGFFAMSLATNSTQFVIAVVIVMLFLNFFRTGVKYGGSAFYACFVAAAIMVPNVTSDATMRRVQQNTFGVMIYIAIAIALFPAVPSTILTRIRTRSLKQMSVSMVQLTGRYFFFKETLQKGSGDSTTVMMSHEQWIEDCQSQLAKAEALIATERSVLPLADIEPSLRRRPFPTALAREFFTTQEKIASLHQTMLAAWKGILLEAEAGDDQVVLKSILATLAPRVHDFVAGVVETINMITVVVTDSHANLTTDLTRCTLQVRTLALDISNEQRRAMLDMANVVQSAAASGFTTPVEAAHPTPPPQETREVENGFFEAQSDSGDEATSDPYVAASPSANTFQVSEITEKSPLKSPLKSPQMSRQFSSRALYSIDDTELPISNFDVSALHCLTFSCISIGYELRRLFVAAEALQQTEVAAVGY